jgi:hypothetical protein
MWANGADMAQRDRFKLTRQERIDRRQMEAMRNEYDS